MNEAPIIETPRLILRGHRLDDFNASAAMWGDAAVTRYIGGLPFSEEEVWARLLRYAGHWRMMDFGYWVLEERDTGIFVGEAGFADFRRDVEFAGKGAPELGWALASQAHGKGYATESVRAIVAWGDTRFKRARTVCLIHPENLRSIRVAEKCGYRESERTSYKRHPTIVFAR